MKQKLKLCYFKTYNLSFYYRHLVTFGTVRSSPSTRRVLKKSLWLRSIRRQVISDRYYFGCLLFLGCFEWLCNHVFLKAIVCLMRAERNQYFCVKRGCFVCKSFTVVTIISKINWKSKLQIMKGTQVIFLSWNCDLQI